MLTISHSPIQKAFILEDNEGQKRTLSAFVLKPFKADLKACSSWQEFSTIEKRAALRYSLTLISKRDYLTPELEKKLKEKGFCKEVIAEASFRCTKEGFLSDARFIEGFIEAKKSRYGPKVLEIRLKAKGADPSLITKSLKELYSDSETCEDITRMLRQRSADLTDFKSRQKWMAKLLRRGYSMTTIQRSFETHLSVSYDQCWDL